MMAQFHTTKHGL
jgi:hypothetical protein